MLQPLLNAKQPLRWNPLRIPQLSTTMATPLEQAERLKTEGNALFVKNDFTGACQKYTEAITHDKNAILYCNRAACAFGLNRYNGIWLPCQDHHLGLIIWF